jgi:hypothetical protein
VECARTTREPLHPCCFCPVPPRAARGLRHPGPHSGPLGWAGGFGSARTASWRSGRRGQCPRGRGRGRVRGPDRGDRTRKQIGRAALRVSPCTAPLAHQHFLTSGSTPTMVCQPPGRARVRDLPPRTAEPGIRSSAAAPATTAAGRGSVSPRDLRTLRLRPQLAPLRGPLPRQPGLTNSCPNH